MADKIPLVAEKTIKVDGFFELQQVYSHVKTYFENERQYDTSEKYFFEKNNADDKDLQSIVVGEVHVSDYYVLYIKYKLFLNGKEVKIEINGKTKKIVQGHAKLQVFSYAEYDHLGKKKSSPLMTLVDKLYEKYFHADEIKKLKKKGKEDTDGLIATFKKQVRSKVN